MTRPGKRRQYTALYAWLAFAGVMLLVWWVALSMPGCGLEVSAKFSNQHSVAVVGSKPLPKDAGNHDD